MALILIEYHAKCRFHLADGYGKYLHELSEEDQAKVTNRLAAWWQEVKDKPVAAGVRSQLVYGSSYSETIWMAKTLARIADEKTDDREFALHFLRQMVSKNPRDHVGTYAADALAEFGDLSAVDIFYAEWKSLVGDEGQVFKPHVAFYLCRHGRRREWELMHELSLDEVRRGKGPGWGAVWSCVVNSDVVGKNPYAIPILALALDQTESTGSRYVPKIGSQSFSYADTACELLEKQVEKDFGYRRNGTADERLAAIRKARDWWDKEGEGKYTFEKIEKLLPAKAAPSRPRAGE